jgi:diguanylate cyclase (GGDEF)-like protein/PAS domain S-box-containing protein
MTVFFSSRRLGGPDPVAAAKALFQGDGPLSRTREPASVVRADGAVIVANAAARAVAEPLGLGDHAPLAPPLAAAVAAQSHRTVEIAIGSGTLTLDVFPLAPGSGEHGAVALVLGRGDAAGRALSEALAESRGRYKALVELSNDFAWETGADGAFVFVSPKGALGYGADELVGRRPESFAAGPAPVPSPFAPAERVAGVSVWWRRKDGAEACLIVAAEPVRGTGGRIIGARGVCRDATAELRHAAALARASEREGLLAHIVRLMRDEPRADAMLAAACASSARALAAGTCRIYRTGPGGAAAPAAAFGAASSDTDDDALVVRALRADGPVASGAGGRIACRTIYRGAVNGAILLARAAPAAEWTGEDRALLAGLADQIGIALAQIESHAELERLSRTDPLTGLLNRRAFEEELTARLARAGSAAAPGALVFVDLDNFKPVNDVHGHEKGDDALKATAALLRARTRPGDLVARLGGDEFALWLDRMGADAAAARAQEIVASGTALAAFSAGPDRPLGFSVGAAVHRPGRGEDGAALIARADAAMYEVKRHGKGGFRMADDEPTPAVRAEPAQ